MLIRLITCLKTKCYPSPDTGEGELGRKGVQLHTATTTVRSFRRADAEPSFRRSRTPHGIFARFLKNPPRGSSDSWENLARGFSVSLFRQSDECLFFPDRDALEIERASIGRDARRFRFRVRVTDGQTRAERTARALPHTSDDMSRSTSDDD